MHYNRTISLTLTKRGVTPNTVHVFGARGHETSRPPVQGPGMLVVPSGEAVCDDLSGQLKPLVGLVLPNPVER